MLSIKLYFISSLVVGGTFISYLQDSVEAQITPDRTLPNNSSVTRKGDAKVIEGGTQSGSNLFHSFGEFSVPTNTTVYFNNNLVIKNIISRVTGGKQSNIDGLIRANGTANLFLINPSGIIFGENARLDIGGSLIASTANSLKFDDGFEFSATANQATPLLSINVPVGLQYGTNNGSIQVLGDGQGRRNIEDPIINTQEGLRVESNRTLALVGGNVSLEGATLKTAGGRIELGSVAGNGLVKLNSQAKGFALDYNSVPLQNFGLIQLSQQATADASGSGGGEVLVTGKNITLTDASSFEASTLGSQPGSTLVINATENVQLTGVGRNSKLQTGFFANVNQDATGTGGNLTINARSLLLSNYAQVNTGAGNAGQKGGDLTINADTLMLKSGGAVFADTGGAGLGGNLNINARLIQLIGAGSGFFSQQTNKDGTGDAGNITIRTRTLQVEDGAVVLTGTQGAGKGGDLTVNASSVKLIGVAFNPMLKDFAPSALFALANPDSTGDAGNLTITTRQLLMQNGAQGNSSTSGTGKGGNLIVNAEQVQLIGTTSTQLIGTASTKKRVFSSGLYASSNATKTDGVARKLEINTRTLLVKDGAVVATSTTGAAQGGNLTVNASDSVEIIGTVASDRNSGSSVFADAERKSTGDAGDVTINTSDFIVRDGARASVRSQGSGQAGNLTIKADSIRLYNNAVLDANTSTDSNQEQATINLHASDFILLRDRSNITATAKGGNVIGGNINIDTNLLAGFGNSDIAANSENFQGGNVNINTKELLGIQPTDEENPATSDITASGANPQLSGTVQINATNVDINRGLINLPSVPIDTKIVSNCHSYNLTNSSFTIVGQGGLPPNPKNVFDSEDVLVDWVSPKPSPQTSTTKPTIAPIIEATRIVQNTRGELLLTTTPRWNRIQCR